MSVFVAKNKNGINIKKLQEDSLAGRFPGGKGGFIEEDGIFKLKEPFFSFCWVKFEGTQIKVIVEINGCWNRYSARFIQYLKNVCGGEVEIDKE